MRCEEKVNFSQCCFAWSFVPKRKEGNHQSWRRTNQFIKQLWQNCMFSSQFCFMTSLAFCEHCRWCLLTQNRAPVCLARSFLSPEFHPLIWAAEREEAHFNDSNSAYSWGLVTKLHIPLPFIRVGNQNHNLVVDHFLCRVIFSFFSFFHFYNLRILLTLRIVRQSATAKLKRSLL